MKIRSTCDLICSAPAHNTKQNNRTHEIWYTWSVLTASIGTAWLIDSKPRYRAITFKDWAVHYSQRHGPYIICGVETSHAATHIRLWSSYIPDVELCSCGVGYRPKYLVVMKTQIFPIIIKCTEIWFANLFAFFDAQFLTKRFNLAFIASKTT
jgi:hypothetical protein